MEKEDSLQVLFFDELEREIVSFCYFKSFLAAFVSMKMDFNECGEITDAGLNVRSE